MAYTVQVVIDAREPHVLADWWAETLGWEVEEQDETFIRRMIEQGHATEADTSEHRGSLVWRIGSAIVPPAGVRAPRILFQEVPEAKTLKNRVHLDVPVGDDDVEAVRARLIARGATVLHHGRHGPNTWVTLADPEGNEFCV
jgi:hypothetical protein